MNLPLNSSPFPQDNSSLLQPNQLSPQSACSPRPSSSGTVLDMNNATTNGYHRPCSPSSLSGGSSSPNSMGGGGGGGGGGSGSGRQDNSSPPNVSSSLANRNNVRVVLPNNPHINMVRLLSFNLTYFPHPHFSSLSPSPPPTGKCVLWTSNMQVARNGNLTNSLGSATCLLGIPGYPSSLSFNNSKCAEIDQNFKKDIIAADMEWKN